MNERSVNLWSRPGLLLWSLAVVTFAGLSLHPTSGSPQAELNKPNQPIIAKDINIKFSGRWASVEEIEAVARSYVRARDSGFTHIDTRASVWVEPRGTGVVATVFFNSGIGGSAWKVDFTPSGGPGGYSVGPFSEGK